MQRATVLRRCRGGVAEAPERRAFIEVLGSLPFQGTRERRAPVFWNDP
jgi:hypothetical protein